HPAEAGSAPRARLWVRAHPAPRGLVGRRASRVGGVRAKAPGFVPGKPRLQPPLDADEAQALATAFLLDRLDAVTSLVPASAVLAFAPPEAEGALRALAPPGPRLVPPRGGGLGAPLSRLVPGLATEPTGAAALG